MATSRIDITSDEFINIKCGPCAEENRTRQADKYCLECKDYYCLPCTGLHKRFPALKGHKLLDKTDFGSLASDGSLPSFSTQRCSLHPSKVVDMFCKEHDDVACASCIALDHRTCKTIFSIPENVDKLYKSTEMTEIKQKINKTKKTVEDIKKEKEQKFKELKQAYEKEVKSIKAFRKELQTLLDIAEQETLKELKQNFDRDESCLTSEMKEINNLIDTMHEVSTQLKRAEGNKAQEFVSMKISEKVTAKAEEVEIVQPRKTEETVSFTADQKIKAFLEGIQSLGNVSKVTSNKQSITYSKDRLYKVKHQRGINIKFINDSSNCFIYCSCLTEDGALLLTDYGNKRLKRLDMSKEKVKDYIDLQAGPLAVCLVSKSEAVVTLDNWAVQFVSLGNKLSAAHVLSMAHRCFGLAHKDGKLFISDYGKNVFIYDMNGHQLQRISNGASGNALFLRTAHLTVRDRVFVADYNKGVVVLDILGNHLSTLTYPTLSGIWGVCTDVKHLFACGKSSGNIVQIGQDYKLMGELAKITNPTSVCFDPHKTRLIVTHVFNNNITVLELE